MKKYSFVCKLYLFVIAALLLVAGCDSALSDPPIAVTFRTGVLSDFVLQASNMSADKSLEIYLYVADETHSVRSGNVILHPNTTKEFGTLEIDWSFKPGDKGFVSARGIAQKLFFTVTDQRQYRTWFGFDDIPEVDVAAQVRARREAERKARIEADSKAAAIAGRNLFVLVLGANVEREAQGFAPVWPRAADVSSGANEEKGVMEKLKGLKSKVVSRLGGKQDRAKEEADISEMKFTTSGEYFHCLFDADNIGKEKHAPYVGATNLTVVAVGIRNGEIPPESVKWSVLADYEDEMSDGIPMLVSANFPCERLCSFWDGKANANDVIRLLPAGELGDAACVIIYKSGNAKVLSAPDVRLSNIYDGPFNTLTNGYNKTLRYLTPHGVQTAQTVMRSSEDARIAATRSLIKNVNDACISYSVLYGRLPDRLSDLQKGTSDASPILKSDTNFLDSWGNEIKYEKKGKRFYLTSFGPDGKEGTDDDLTNIRHQ